MKTTSTTMLCILLLALVACQQTTTNKNTTAFFMRQDSLFIKAYEKRDTATYQKLLDEFLQTYNNQSSNVRKQYTGSYVNAYYNLCCTYALTENKALAMKYLGKSIEAGYTDYSHLQSDKDLIGIRNDPAFKTLTEPLRKVGDYLFILKRAGKYNPEDSRALPDFTYQSSDNQHLVQLRKAFNLDSIAGQADEISKIKNLLHWIHNLIPHDGNHGNPDVKNARSMIAECKKGNRGLNCRGLATVLNECYLSMGFKSRFVTCLPKDSLKMDFDCHVINMVYSNSKKKWLWMDPTNDAYVMNEKGELLSIEEVRERIIKGMPLVVNADANWNHKSAVTIDDYLYRYMAKNLYILQCPVSSEYDSETYSKGKTISYIELLPLDYFNQLPDKKVENEMIIYRTNNAKLFWQTPK